MKFKVGHLEEVKSHHYGHVEATHYVRVQLGPVEDVAPYRMHHVLIELSPSDAAPFLMGSVWELVPSEG